MRGWRAVRTGRPARLGWLGSRWLQSSCGRFGGMNGQRGVASLGRGLGRSQVVGGGLAPPAASSFQLGGSKPKRWSCCCVCSDGL